MQPSRVTPGTDYNPPSLIRQAGRRHNLNQGEDVGLTIEDKRKASCPRAVGICDIPDGTYFYGRLSGASGLFLKVFERVVWVANPTSTWSGGMIYDYQPVNATLTITSNAE